MADYLNQLIQLQPPGEALPTDPDSTWVKLLDGLAQEFERVDSRAAALIRESDPRQALELLSDWERVCGLPGDCPIAWDSTLQARRAAVVAQITGAGGQTEIFYRRLADMLGLEITVTEYKPFLAGLSSCGGRLNGGHDVRTVWSVVVRGKRAIRFRCGASQTGDKLLSITNRKDLECLLRKYAPAHTTLVVGYEATGV